MALLALALIIFWPPVHYGSASPGAHAMFSAEAPVHHPLSDQHDPPSLFSVKLDGACDAAAAGCCMMAHCCQGIAIAQPDLPLFAGNEGRKAAPATRGAGSDPALVLPPPRTLQG